MAPGCFSCPRSTRPDRHGGRGLDAQQPGTRNPDGGRGSGVAHPRFRQAANPMKHARLIVPLISLVVASLAGAALAQDATWSTFNGNLRAEKYSPLTQITPENVNKLRMVWSTRTGDVQDRSGGGS